MNLIKGCYHTIDSNLYKLIYKYNLNFKSKIYIKNK